ncbi:DUF5954 family protein [Micromonospora sp. WMMD1082]|uniref:DUF5954 family protein n=1 Tax=Micromonospora sp. WMMD1082 TaxID=3016104 RepID=UPI002417F302|nr:DUF5954 family protein [Micromonospora sp. WMMD1082]MDG4798348.1 DUF5954 family protein [Micromonospora sp. WMMD1082]
MSHEEHARSPAVVRVERPTDPVGAITDHDAVSRTHAYPVVRIGAPLFGHAVDLGDGRWQVHALLDHTPQDARNTLAHRLRERLLDTTDPALAAEVTAVAQLLDREKIDEVVVAGQIHRVIRADTFARFGPDGPEPPRPTDPDPRDFTDHDSFCDEEVIADPAAATGVGTAMLKVDLLTAHYPRALVPADVYADSVAAVRSHPHAAVLPARYAAAEHVDGAWQPISHAVATPQEARDELAFTFRHIEPRHRPLTPDQNAAYQQAADHLDRNRIDEITALGRRFRITRVETLLRFSPNGPEGPRPSDHDPDPPPEAAANTS